MDSALGAHGIVFPPFYLWVRKGIFIEGQDLHPFFPPKLKCESLFKWFDAIKD